MKHPFASRRKSTAALLFACVTFLTNSRAEVVDKIDWKSFLSRHDMVWKRLPDRFENAAYTGNGKMGAMVFTANKGQSIRWQIGRSDVAFMTARIPIGDPGQNVFSE